MFLALKVKCSFGQGHSILRFFFPTSQTSVVTQKLFLFNYSSVSTNKPKPFKAS